MHACFVNAMFGIALGRGELMRVLRPHLGGITGHY